MKFSHCLFIFAVTFFSCSEKVEPQPEGIPDPVVLMDSVIYHVTESDTLQMNLYSLDIHENLQQDVIMIVHGGGFMGGSRNSETIDTFCKQASNNGFKVASIDYTLALKGSTFDCEQTIENKVSAIEIAAADILLARQYLTEHADKRKHSGRVFLLGSSAGAEAALHACFSPSLADSANTPSFLGLISLAGAVIDTSWINPSNALPTLLYHGTCDPLVPFASDIHHYCPDDSPGALMLHGSWSIAGQLESLGMPWQLYTFCGDDHRVANNPFLSNGEDIIRFCRDISEGLLETKHTIFPGDSDCFIDPEFCKVEGIRRE